MMRWRRGLLELGLASAAASLAAACSSSSPAPASPFANDAGNETSGDGGSEVVAADAGPVSAPGDSGDPTGPAGGDAHSDAPAPDAGPAPLARQSLVWVWQDYANALKTVTSNASSFTHVSPALYQLNYSYSSGTAQLLNTNDQFDGLSSQQVAQTIHAAGLLCVPLMYAGAGNDGTDQGIQNVLNDSPAGAQSSFISSMVTEGMAKGYDGFNLDWEVQTTGASYASKYVSFMAAFKSALNAHGMSLSVDLGGWYVTQCAASGGDGLVDLTKLGTSVDLAIIEDYSGAFNEQATGCPSKVPATLDCDTDYSGGLEAMCDLPANVVSIGLISPGTNSFADRALDAVSSQGFTSVAVWPDDSTFMNGDGIPNGATWYSLLAKFLGH